MSRKLTKNLVSLALLVFIFAPVFVFALSANVALAGNSDSMFWAGTANNVQTASGLGNKDPREMAGSVIHVILGFLGIIAVLIILYGGFRWMTAAGNEDGVSTAKKTIGAGVIGLIIILAAYALSAFVLDALYNATGASG